MSSTETTYGYSRQHRVVEVVCIAAVFVLLVAFGAKMVHTVGSPAGWTGMAITVVVAYLASDAISGLVHWAGDTIGDEKVPFLGPNFIRPFRQHHLDQGDIARHDFVETNGNNCIVIVGPTLIAYLLMPSHLGLGFFGAAFVAFFSLFVVATNQFHKWAHTAEPPRVARVLQRLGLILSPRHHQKHHAVPHDRHYCITVGWMNPPLNRIRFFRMLEWMIAQVRPHWLHIEERRVFAAQMLAAAARQDTAATERSATS